MAQYINEFWAHDESPTMMNYGYMGAIKDYNVKTMMTLTVTALLVSFFFFFLLEV